MQVPLTIMARLQPADIESIRASAPPLPLTAAPLTSSDKFKSEYARWKPLAKQFQHHFSLESRDFAGSVLKKTSGPSTSHKIISLGTGRPTADYYPWNNLSLHTSSPVSGTLKSDSTSIQQRSAGTISKHGDTYNLSIGLNYGHASGSAHLLRFITEHIELIHNPPYSDWATYLSCGATASLEVAFRIFCNRGDTVLTEQYTYPGTLESAALNGINIHGIEMDIHGLLPDALEKILSSWDPALSQSPKPHVLYTIPTGQNPTGFTQPLERRKAIYQIAEKHDLIIIEDDPYYFLRTGPYQDISNGINEANGINGHHPTESQATSRENFHIQSIPSFLALDTSGRVVRLDSAAKILAPGLRVGWVTASTQIIDKFLAYQEVSTVAVNGPSQLMLWHLLDQMWGHDGFTSWLVHLSQEYKQRRDILLGACGLYLPRKIARWSPPDFGMFLWINIDWKQHPRLSSLAGSVVELDALLLDLEERIAARSLEKGVLVTKGSLFSYDKKPNGQLHFRMTFAAASEDDLKTGVELFAEALREEFGLT